MCYPAHSPVFTHLRVGFEKSQKIVIFWIFLHPSLDEQYGKIGFPNNKDLSNSSDVVYVHEYTRDDGTVVKAHYRSKAGEGDPNKAVMQSLGEYKTEIEKEIDKFMTQDAYNRYGENAIIGNKQKTETEENEQQDNIDYAAFYPGGAAIQQLSESDDLQNAFSVNEINIPEEKYSPSEKLLTGGIEISRDLDNEIPAVEYRKEPNREIPSKKQQEPKYSPNYKPYTGREMNLSNITFPEQKFKSVKEEKRQATNTTDLLNQNSVLFKIAKYPIAPSLQAMVGKSKIFSRLLNQNRPLSADYYRLSLEPEKYKKEDNENIFKKISDFDNTPLKRHLMQLDDKINSNTMVVLPKQESRLIKTIKQSSAIRNFILSHEKEIFHGQVRNKTLSNLNFYNENDLATLIGEAHVYNAYIDKTGSLYMQIPDYYNFIDRGQETPTEAINYNAYVQQEQGKLTNYVLLITIKFSKDELKAIFNSR